MDLSSQPELKTVILDAFSSSSEEVTRIGLVNASSANSQLTEKQLWFLFYLCAVGSSGEVGGVLRPGQHRGGEPPRVSAFRLAGDHVVQEAVPTAALTQGDHQLGVRVRAQTLRGAGLVPPAQAQRVSGGGNPERGGRVSG